MADAIGDKRELLLEYIIREYINNPEPIGSEYLKLRLDIKISSATIRNYFKKMVEDGALEQPHISAGRIPSNNALKSYWKGRLLPIRPINVSSLGRLIGSAQDVGVLCVLKYFEPNNLVEVIKVQDRYLIMVLQNGEIVCEYSPELETFLQELLLMDILDIYKVAKQVHIHELVTKIEEHINKNPIERGGEHLLSIAKDENMEEQSFLNIVEGNVIDQVGEGMYFEEVVPSGYLAIKQNIVINQENAKLLFLGRLHRDFERFYTLTEKENDGKSNP